MSIQDKDGGWHWANGTIDGSELVVRYAYTNHPIGPLLFSKDGLPVAPFSTIGYGPEPSRK